MVEEELGAAGVLPTLPRATASLSFSPASLRRHLAAEGSSYTAVCDELRRALALAAVTDDRESLDELAGRLGFSEAGGAKRSPNRAASSSARATACGSP